MKFLDFFEAFVSEYLFSQWSDEYSVASEIENLQKVYFEILNLLIWDEFLLL